MNLSKKYRPIKGFMDLVLGQKVIVLSLAESGKYRYTGIVGRTLSIREIEDGTCEHYDRTNKKCISDGTDCPCFGSYVCLEDEDEWYSSCYVILGDEYGRPIKE